MTSLLEICELSVEYRTARGALRALDGVTVQVEEGECLALIGESGSGKSTLGQAVVGLLPRTARTAGRITYGGGHEPLSVLPASDRQLRRYRWAEVAYVAQNAINAFNPVQRIGRHFEETWTDHGRRFDARARGRARELLTQVRLEPDRVWSAYPHELSGGMKQRTLLALALLLEPRVLVLDEPTTALDVITQQGVVEILAELRAAHGVAVVFISHDLAVAAEVADRVLTMYAGRVVEAGATDRVSRQPRHHYTAGLVRAIPDLAGLRSASAIPGSPPDLVQLTPGCAFAPRCPAADLRCRTEQPPGRPVEGRIVECHHPVHDLEVVR